MSATSVWGGAMNAYALKAGIGVIAGNTV